MIDLTKSDGRFASLRKAQLDATEYGYYRSLGESVTVVEFEDGSFDWYSNDNQKKNGDKLWWRVCYKNCIHPDRWQKYA